MNLQSDTLDQIIPDLIKARGQFNAAVKDSANPHYKSKYVSLDGVIDAITEGLQANNLYCVQQTDIVDGKIQLHTKFIHTSGQWIGGIYPIHPVKNDPQGEGSALTYGRRYALMALAGIAPEDDDGNAATKAATKQNKVSDNAGKADDGMLEAAASLGWSKEKIEKVAATANEYWEIQDVIGALEFLASQDMPQEAKIVANKDFDSKFRAAMKKQLQENRENGL